MPAHSTRLALRWLATLALLGVLAWQLDLSAVLSVLGAYNPWLLVPVLVLTVVQVTVSAWRWRYTAGRLGVPLPAGIAVREYYLATFLNQVLPGGVVGDINRAWRQSLGSEDRMAALHSVMIERLSGQLVLAVVVVALAILVLPMAAMRPGITLAAGWQFWIIPAIAVALAVLLWRNRSIRYFSRLRGDIYRSLLRWPAPLVQGLSSLVVLAAYLGVFLILASGQQNWAATGSPWMLTAMASLLLLAMVIPLTVAGWGVREGMAGVIWAAVGWPPEQGVALSIGYGLVTLVCSLPGGLVMWLPAPGLQKNPDQTAYQNPD